MKTEDANRRYRAYQPADQPAIRRLLSQTPFGESIRFCLDETEPPKPNAIVAARHRLIATDTSQSHQISLMAERSVHQVFYHGAPARIGYLGQLRLLPGGRLGLDLMREGFAELLANRSSNETSFDFTSIFQENRRARRLLERGLPGLPNYRECGRMQTLTFPCRRARKFSSAIRPIRRADCEAIADFWRRQSAPYGLSHRLEAEGLAALLQDDGLLTRGWVARDCDTILGTLLLIDQRRHKSVIIQSYTGWLARLRTWVNALRILQRRLLLPPPGATLNMGYLAFCFLRTPDPTLLTNLIATAAEDAATSGMENLSIGFPSHHWAAEVLKQQLAPEITHSIIYAVESQDQPPANLSQTTIYPEIAFL